MFHDYQTTYQALWGSDDEPRLIRRNWSPTVTHVSSDVTGAPHSHPRPVNILRVHHTSQAAVRTKTMKPASSNSLVDQGPVYGKLIYACEVRG